MRRYRIGRADTNDIVLADSTVSREHAELAELGEGRYAIKDLGSTYGISIRRGAQWEKVPEAEIAHDTPFRIGDYETSADELLRDTDRTVVRPHAPRQALPPGPSAAPVRTSPPRPAPPRPPRAAAQPADPSGTARSAPVAAVPPQRAAPAFRFLRDLPPEKRPLVWVGIGFAAFLLIALITLILALAL
jgi:hypothetical protein